MSIPRLEEDVSPKFISGTCTVRMRGLSETLSRGQSTKTEKRSNSKD